MKSMHSNESINTLSSALCRNSVSIDVKLILIINSSYEPLSFLITSSHTTFVALLWLFCILLHGNEDCRPENKR